MKVPILLHIPHSSIHIPSLEESGEISIGGPAANRTRILSSGDSRSIHSTTGPAF